jgi:predicted nucleotidyltransferase
LAQILFGIVTFTLVMTNLTQIHKRLGELKPYLQQKYHVRNIGLFGSVVRDDFQPGISDVDILVDFSEPVGIEFVDLAELLEQELQTRVDLVSKRGVKPILLAEIEPELIYV